MNKLANLFSSLEANITNEEDTFRLIEQIQHGGSFNLLPESFWDNLDISKLNFDQTVYLLQTFILYGNKNDFFKYCRNLLDPTPAYVFANCRQNDSNAITYAITHRPDLLVGVHVIKHFNVNIDSKIDKIDDYTVREYLFRYNYPLLCALTLENSN